jgi:hypothetical protein
MTPKQAYEHHAALQRRKLKELPERVRELYEDLEKSGDLRVNKAWLEYKTPYKQLCDTTLVRIKDVGGEWLEIETWDKEWKNAEKERIAENRERKRQRNSGLAVGALA